MALGGAHSLHLIGRRSERGDWEGVRDRTRRSAPEDDTLQEHGKRQCQQSWSRHSKQGMARWKRRANASHLDGGVGGRGATEARRCRGMSMG